MPLYLWRDPCIAIPLIGRGDTLEWSFKNRPKELLHWHVLGITASLPWSTSATGILVAIWVVVSVAFLDRKSLRNVASVPAVALPLALCVLAIIGTAWSHAGLADRWDGLASFLRLLAFPFFAAQYAQFGRGKEVAFVFLTSCTLLLVVSFALKAWPNLPHNYPGVLVKDYIVQSTEFAICGMVLADWAIIQWRSARRIHAVSLAVVATGFFANIFLVASGRTTFVIVGGITLLCGWRHGRLKGLAIATVLGFAVVAVSWSISPYFRSRILNVQTEVSDWQQKDAVTSSGLRLVFWEKAFRMIEKAPLLGHGTGSIPLLYAEAAQGITRADAELSSNPHNQTLTIGIQLGCIGVALLWSMWLCHFSLFRLPGPLGWIGIVLVVQNVVGSVFNSLLFDFTESWTYIVGVGVTTGMVFFDRNRRNGDGSTIYSHNAGSSGCESSEFSSQLRR